MDIYDKRLNKYINIYIYCIFIMNQNRNVVSDTEQSTLIEWIYSNRSKFTFNNNNNQTFINIDDIENIEISNIIQNIKTRVIQNENLFNYSSSNELLGDFMYISETGTKLHYHIDYPADKLGEKQKNKVMVRFNVCIKKPEKGGRPIYSGKMIDLVENEYVICLSGIEYHTSEWIVTGTKINISFGFLIDVDDLYKYMNRENILVNDVYINTWTNSNICVDTIQPGNYEINELTTISYEQYLYKIAIEHLKRLNKYVETDNFIEYSIVDENYEFNYENYNKIEPVLTILFFISNETSPIILTNINNESYKYKEVTEHDNILVYIPKNNTHIVLEESNYYSFINGSQSNDICLTPKKYLKLNVWDKNMVPTQINTSFVGNTIDTCNIVLNTRNNIILKESVYCNLLLDDLLYESPTRIIEQLKTFILKYKDVDIFLINGSYTPEINYTHLSEKYGEITDDIFPFFNKSLEISKNNRFYKNIIIQNTLCKNVCYWIINECKNSVNWKTNVYNTYGDYLNIEHIPSVLNFITFVLYNLLYQIQKIYSINESIKINITDIFVSKFTSDNCRTESNSDNSFLSINIHLSDFNMYSGGELILDGNEEYIKIVQGDMFIYNGKIKKQNCKINSGEQYVLVFLTELLFD